MRKPKNTVSALAEFLYTPPGGGPTVHCIEEIAIRIATVATCVHEDTICPECVESWQPEHLFTERLPWEPGTGTGT